MSEQDWRFCGNRQSVEQLRRAVVQRNPRHAFIITGAPSLGKRALAQRFAQALLCEQPAGGSPCFVCGSCRRVQRDTHPDVTLLSLERQNAQGNERGKGTTLTIETVRSVASTAPLKPLNGQWRFFLFDDAELLMPDAQEALLKTLEEPPPFLVLFLLATEVEALLPTVRSRCEIVELARVPPAEIETFLLQGDVEADLASAAAEFSGGAPGWAIQASQSPSMIEERVSVVEQAAGWIDSSDFERIATAFSLSDALARQKAETLAVLAATAVLWRDAMLVRSGNSDRITFRAYSEIADLLAGSHEIAELLGAVSAVAICLEDLQNNVRPRLALESMVLSWPRMPTRS